MCKEKILIIDDEELIRITLSDDLKKEGYEVITAIDGRDGLKKYREVCPALILMDIKMPGIDGISLLEKVMEHHPGTMVIMMTGYGTMESAIKAMKSGAYDYISKPFLPEDMILLVKRALEVYGLREENRSLHKRLDKHSRFKGLIGENEKMQGIYHLIDTVAKSTANVIIYGETGTGKERVAEAIHNTSSRKEKPLIKVSCSVLSEKLLESELFGHEKGAFTDAVSRKIGRFEMADGGSLFLDDVDDLKYDVQVKLLRVIQEKEFERVGGTKTLKTDVRIIAASKCDLSKLVKEGVFRDDLYFRINVIPINIPPLRKKKDDIPLLVEHFLRKYGKDSKKTVSPQALRLLMQYDWPGNVRELENMIERIVTLTQGKEIRPVNLPAVFKESDKESISKSIKEVKKETEKKYLLEVLKKTKGKKKEAAKLLGISAKTLWQKLKEYNINETLHSGNSHLSSTK